MNGMVPGVNGGKMSSSDPGKLSSQRLPTGVLI
jgi:hypothetical protein